MHGLNVTIPYKEAVIPYLNALDETAQAIGAVNTIRVRDGNCTGYNTDAIGFEKSLQKFENGRWLQAGSASALILGTGGAAKAVAYILEKYGIPFRFVSRNPAGPNQVDYPGLRSLNFDSIRWIFNATPLGTFPETDNCPDLPYEKIHAAQLVYDLIYNPAETLLLQRTKAQGATVKNGLEMLYLQAEAAWAIWQTAESDFSSLT